MLYSTLALCLLYTAAAAATRHHRAAPSHVLSGETHHVDKLSALPHGTSLPWQIAGLAQGICPHALQLAKGASDMWETNYQIGFWL